MRKYLFILLVSLFGLVFLSALEYFSFNDGKLRIVVCDVGQGDGVIIKSPSGKVVLFDAGPDDSILKCLSDVLPFWQKSIDIAMVSHPHADHFSGMFSILPEYTVRSYISETIVNRSESFQELGKALKKENLSVIYAYRGHSIDLGDGTRIRVLGPSREFAERVSPTGDINDVTELISLIVLVEYGSFSALLTGDSVVSGIQDALPPDVTYLQVPHHGSASGLDEYVLERIDPEIATISVGKNKYGHPTSEIISLLDGDKIPTYRTDHSGTISLSTDGRKHTVKTERSRQRQ